MTGDARNVETGQMIGATTANFCSAIAMNAEPSADAEGNRYEAFYILGDVEGEGYPIDNIRIFVRHKDDSVVVFFSPASDVFEVRDLKGVVGVFYGKIRECATIDPLWKENLTLRRIVSISFDGLAITDGPDGLDFQKTKKRIP